MQLGCPLRPCQSWGLGPDDHSNGSIHAPRHKNRETPYSCNPSLSHSCNSPVYAREPGRFFHDRNQLACGYHSPGSRGFKASSSPILATKPPILGVADDKAMLATACFSLITDCIMGYRLWRSIIFWLGAPRKLALGISCPMPHCLATKAFSARLQLPIHQGRLCCPVCRLQTLQHMQFTTKW